MFWRKLPACVTPVTVCSWSKLWLLKVVRNQHICIPCHSCLPEQPSCWFGTWQAGNKPERILPSYPQFWSICDTSFTLVFESQEPLSPSLFVSCSEFGAPVTHIPLLFIPVGIFHSLLKVLTLLKLLAWMANL